MARRRQKLEDSLKLHQFIFDADSELLWIKDHKPAVTSLDYGKNLIDAQNLHAKHKKLDVELQGHQPMIDRVLAGGNALVKARHFATPAIQDKAAELSSTWSELLKQSADRKRNLDVSVEKQKVKDVLRRRFEFLWFTCIKLIFLLCPFSFWVLLPDFLSSDNSDIFAFAQWFGF